MLIKRLITAVLFLLQSTLLYAAPTDLVGSSAWTSLFKSDRFDLYSDTQAQKAGTEIVGDAAHTSFFVNYDDNATTSNLTDDILSLRIRIGDETKSTHSAYVFFGIDADGDGKLDIFVSSGSGNTQLWLAGSDANTSPSTTSLATTASYTYVQGTSNYNFALVSGSNDPDWDGNTDLNSDGHADVFISLSVPMSDIAALLQTLGITFTDSTPLRFVSLSATQTNALNSDFDGIDNGTNDNWSSLFEDLGILSTAITASGPVDTTPPQSPSVNGLITNDTTPTITGSYDATDAAGGFTVSVNGVTYTLGDGNLTTSGNDWSLTIPAGDSLGENTYEVTATANDANGNSASDTTTNELVVDLIPPSAPTVNSQTSNSFTPTITGSYDAVDAAGGFSVTVNGVTYTLGDGYLSASGNTWTLLLPAGNALSDGTYEVTATATDAAGNSSSDITNNELFIDTTGPTAPTVTSQTTNDTTPTITGTYDAADSAGGFSVTVNGVTYSLGDGNLTASGNNWNLNIPTGNALSEGIYDVTATSIDGSSNAISDSSSNELVIDLTAPTAPTVVNQTTNDTTPTISGSYVASDAAGGFSVFVNGVSYNLGDGHLSASGNTWTLVIPVANTLNNGTYDVIATATDAAGNSISDGTNNELIIDTSAPTAPTVVKQTTTDTTPTITGTYDAADASGGLSVTVNGVTYTLGDGSLTASGNDWSLSIPAGNTLSDGTYDVTATVTDNVGNTISDTSSNELVIGIDTDGDGVIDSIDLDDDNDGIPDSVEGDGAVDTDHDGIPDSRDLDSDNDGLSDLVESGLANPQALDTNNDGVIDNTNNFGANGLADVVETSADSGAINYTVADTDADGIKDFRDLDSDNDGIPDVTESGGDDPDHDGIIGTGTPTVNSAGVPSGGGLMPIDTDGDGIADFRDLDSDNDGIKDLVEAGGTDSNDDGMVDGFTDTDGNGFDDSVNVIPLPLTDSNHDGIPDYQQAISNVTGSNVSDPVRTGIRGVGGCTVSNGPGDPLLPVLLVLAIIGTNKKYLIKLWRGNKS